MGLSSCESCARHPTLRGAGLSARRGSAVMVGVGVVLLMLVGLALFIAAWHELS